MADEEVKFNQPPLNEIVFQIGFPAISGLTPVHAGLFWSQIRNEFPIVQSAARVGFPATFDTTAGLLPDNRVWLIHKDNSQVIQIQNDRFMFNWRDVGEGVSYPGFERLYPTFKDHLKQFADFLESEEKRPNSYSGFELTYINHVRPGIWREWNELGDVFPAFDWRRNPTAMPAVSGFRHFAQCTLPNDEGELRVTVDSRTHKQTKEKLFYYEIKVTDSDRELGLESIDSVFLPAHDRLVQTLISMTSKGIQDSWNRQ